MNIRQQTFTYQSFVQEYKKRDGFTDTIEGTLTTEENYQEIVKADQKRSNLFYNIDPTTFFDSWNKSKPIPYTQGDITGGSLSNLLWLDVLQENKQSEQESTELTFGYYDDSGARCGLFIKYLNNDPTCWIISISKNFDSSDLSKRTLEFFSSKDLFLPPEQKEKPQELKSNVAEEQLKKAIHCKQVSNLLTKSPLISRNGAIHQSSVELLRTHTSHNKIKSYVDLREKELEKAWFPSLSNGRTKIQAAKKFLDVLQKQTGASFTQEELDALSHSRLGALVKPLIEFLPIKQQEEFRNYQGVAFSRRLRP